ncbi:hypothetical protein SDC9_196729 [bioreactor metagenome]|uniref:Uncharacterized protein n=1 Tax=bioreactor metagenome TaxID=1076179 RepID=A0A645IDX0_9ZZZZ
MSNISRAILIIILRPNTIRTLLFRFSSPIIQTENHTLIVADIRSKIGFQIFSVQLNIFTNINAASDRPDFIVSVADII